VNEELIKIKAAMLKHDVKKCAFADTIEKFKFIEDGPGESEEQPQD
jgi:hypothetical protein